MFDPVYKAGSQSADDPLEFVMSTADVDRMGDIVEQDWRLGAFKQNPIALFQHDSSQPIGTWEQVRVERGRLLGRLKLAAEGTSELIDTIRGLVEQRILRAVSVGFRPKTAEPLDEKDPWGGYRLSDNELLECSLVSVPANAAALAVKSIDADLRRRLFAETGDPCTRSAADQLCSRDSGRTSQPRRKRITAMSLSDKITQKRDELVRLKDAITETMEDGVDETGAITDEADIKLEELNAQVARAEKDLARLEETERSLAVKIKGREDSAAGTGEKLVRPVTLSYQREKGHRALAALHCVLRSHIERVNPIDVCRAHYRDEGDIEQIVRAATIPADTTTTGWAAELVTEAWSEMLSVLRGASVYPSVPGMRLDFGRNGKINVPVQDGKGQLAGTFVAEGAAIPVKQGAFTSAELSPKALKVITTFTREIALHSTPAIESILRNQLIADTAEAIDVAFLDNGARTTTRPAGLQNATETGAGNINASGGATYADILADIKGVIARVSTANMGMSGAWIMDPIRAIGLSTLIDSASGARPFRDEIDGGTLAGYPVLQSTNVPDDVVYFVAGEAMAHATDYAPMVDVSDQATLHMEDTTPIPLVSEDGLTVAAPQRSLWQTDSIGLRLTWGLDWRILRTGGVQVLTGVAW